MFKNKAISNGVEEIPHIRDGKKKDGMLIAYKNSMPEFIRIKRF